MTRWLAFVYRLPPEPSAPRVAVWRALQRLEGIYAQKGVFVAPATPLLAETLRSLAHDVRNDGGEAFVIDGTDLDGDLARRSGGEAKGRRRRSKAAP